MADHVDIHSSPSTSTDKSLVKSNIFQAAISSLRSPHSARGRRRSATGIVKGKNSGSDGGSSHHSRSRSPGRLSIARSKSPSVSGRMAKILSGRYHSLPALPINNDELVDEAKVDESIDTANKRSDDDERQIKRWQQLAGPNGRFRKWLVTEIMKKGGKSKWDDHSISPAIRQTLQHWGYKLTEKDFNQELENRKKKR